MEELEIKINKILAWDMPHAQIEHREEAIKHILELPEIKAIQVEAKVKPGSSWLTEEDKDRKIIEEICDLVYKHKPKLVNQYERGFDFSTWIRNLDATKLYK